MLRIEPEFSSTQSDIILTELSGSLYSSTRTYKRTYWSLRRRAANACRNRKLTDCIRNSGEVPDIPATPMRNERQEMQEVYEMKA